MSLVSVVMPVYNAERYLEEALDSMLAQTHRDFELLALDDGSTDRSREILQSRQRRDSRVRVVGGDHHGLTYWLNAGIELANGPLIARMDADDIALPTRLERQVAYLQQHPECVLLGSQALLVDPDGWPIGRWQVPTTHAEIDGRHIEGRTGAVIHPSAMMRTVAVRAAGGYRPEMELAEDYDLFMRLAEAGTVANVEDSLMRYRLHEKSLTASRTEAQYQAACRALTQAWRRRALPGEAPEARCGKTPPSREDFFWHWCYSALTEQHFPTARKYAGRLVASNPRSVHHWMLWCAAACGPVAYALRKYIPFRPVRSQ